MKIMTKEEFKEMERAYLQWLHKHPKGDYSYKAFSHMRRTLEFAKYWSKLHQHTVSICSCDLNEDYIEQHKGVTRPYCSKCDEWSSKN